MTLGVELRTNRPFQDNLTVPKNDDLCVRVETLCFRLDFVVKFISV